MPASLVLGLASGFPAGAPDQLGVVGFEDRVHHGIVITIAFTAHPLPWQCMFTCMRGGYFEAMPEKAL
jgi:hypothetical protein